MKASGDVEDLLDRIKGAYSKTGSKEGQQDRPEVARSITVHGDAVIASSVHIDRLQTRVTNKMQAEALSLSQAAELAARAQQMATEEEPAEAILTWLAAKFGVPGYLSIPANGFDAAKTYLADKAAADVPEIPGERRLRG